MVRESIFDYLKNQLGHEPLMYEKNFGWTNHKSSIDICLEKVRESDIFLLLVSDRSGTYLI